MCKLSVNILTWNTVKTLHETLHILTNELRGIPSEVIVVDNGSTDGCKMYATIKNETNLGISKGKNQGIDASKGQYILLLDGDIVPVPNSIVCLVNYLDENPDVMALGFYPNKISKERNRGGQLHHEEYCHKLDPVEEYKGHCIYYGIYRREVFEKIRFDESYGAGYGWEDLDSYMQMEKAGIKQYVAGINHKCGKYYHEINSSIRVMGFEKYMETQKQRAGIFSKKWNNHVAKITS